MGGDGAGGGPGAAGGAPGEGDWYADPSEPRYCICNQVSYGDMVACDNEDVSVKLSIHSAPRYNGLRTPSRINGANLDGANAKNKQCFALFLDC